MFQIAIIWNLSVSLLISSTNQSHIIYFQLFFQFFIFFTIFFNLILYYSVLLRSVLQSGILPYRIQPNSIKFNAKQYMIMQYNYFFCQDEAQINVARDIAVQMCDVFDQKDYVGVVNVSYMAAVSTNLVLVTSSKLFSQRISFLPYRMIYQSCHLI